jgi:hypothetical protein
VVATLKRLVELDEFFYECDGIEDNHDCIILNPLGSTIPNWRTFKILWWVQLLNRLMDLDEILYGNDDIKMTSMPYFIIPYLHPFQNGRRLNF